MKKIKESFGFEAKKTTTCPQGEKVAGLTVKEGMPKIKTVIGDNHGGYNLHLDEESEDAVYAKLKVLTKDGVQVGKEDMDDTVSNIKKEQYEVLIESFDEGKNLFKGTINVLGDKTTVKKTGKNAGIEKGLQELIDKKVEEGIMSKEDAEKRVTYMLENSVDEFLIKRVINGWKLYKKPAHVPKTLYFDPYLESTNKSGAESRVSIGVRNAVSRMGTIYEGEKSVGKNVFADTMAWLLGMPLYLFTFSRQMTAASVYGEKSTDNSAAEKLAEFSAEELSLAEMAVRKREMYENMLLTASDEMVQNFAEATGIYIDGMQKWSAASVVAEAMLSAKEKTLIVKAGEFKKLQAQAASVNIVFDESELYEAVAYGGVIVFNEINMGDPNLVTQFCNPLLDGTGFLTFPGRGEVPINKDTVVIGTQNADYEGVEQQNEAMLSRFNATVFEQPDTIKGQLVAGVESNLKADGFACKLDNKYYTETEKFYQKCKVAVDKEDCTNACLNIRGCIRALTVVAESDGSAKLKDWLKQCVINTCPVDERQVLYVILDAIVTL